MYSLYRLNKGVKIQCYLSIRLVHIYHFYHIVTPWVYLLTHGEPTGHTLGITRQIHRAHFITNMCSCNIFKVAINVCVVFVSVFGVTASYCVASVSFITTLSLY